MYNIRSEVLNKQSGDGGCSRLSTSGLCCPALCLRKTSCKVWLCEDERTSWGVLCVCSVCGGGFSCYRCSSVWPAHQAQDESRCLKALTHCTLRASGTLFLLCPDCLLSSALTASFFRTLLVLRFSFSVTNADYLHLLVWRATSYAYMLVSCGCNLCGVCQHI